MDASKSDFGAAPPPESFVRSIEHNEPVLIMTDNQTSALGTEKSVRKYTTDGKEITYEWMGSGVKSSAHWEGDTLVIIGKVDSGGAEIVVTSMLTMSSDGRTLVESDKLSAGGNDIGAFKIVLVKQ